ncbi:YjbQ family protein [Hujiaoplasma nucleasis]|uniref:YjbQ family protein n=1 Tax=Hujiaoplasma nucleasis TaxID=2725268 RepID=A0A7L6N5L0_9MOLU|nr:secondary thiamine-phosphate synthase enzyme YjbQ [Hujiaoplasma nucleasis]QLY40851.1 YjbQ family protein [Hujiaoplasma nucleasis]
MKIYNDLLQVKTNKDEEMIDITEKVSEFVKESKIQNGMVHLFVAHTTAAITINENTDPNVKKDVLLSLRHAFPIEKEFLHFEGNSHAHIKSSVIGNTQSLIVEDNQLKLGRWQAIYFCEFDGPRQRQVYIQIMGE